MITAVQYTRQVHRLKRAVTSGSRKRGGGIVFGEIVLGFVMEVIVGGLGEEIVG